MVTPRLPVRAPRIYPDNPHVRICGGPGSATTLVYPTVNIVSVAGEPAPIEPHQIDSIRRLVDIDLLYDPCPLIHEGMMVEVVHAPLRGVVGRLVRKGSHARLVLAVDLIGQAVSVEVDAADVKAY